MKLQEGDLVADVTGDVGTDEKVLVIEKIHVVYRLQLAAEHREAAERVHGIHAGYCPVARTLRGCVEISTALEYAD